MAKVTKCNMCGKVFDNYDEFMGFSIHRILGYGSKYDGDTLELDLCCECVDKLIEMCTVSPLRAAPKVFTEWDAEDLK